jgi:hypothetical protein
MLDSKLAAKQVERLMGLNFFPVQATARKELILAAQCALSEAVLEKVISDWLGEATECPKPAELRRLSYEANERYAEKKAACTLCEGSGFITVWKLVTYKGNGFVVIGAETLQDVTTAEEASQRAEELNRFLLANPKARKQQILSAAKLCSCRKAA